MTITGPTDAIFKAFAMIAYKFEEVRNVSPLRREGYKVLHPAVVTHRASRAQACPLLGPAVQLGTSNPRWTCSAGAQPGPKAFRLVQAALNGQELGSAWVWGT